VGPRLHAHAWRHARVVLLRGAALRAALRDCVSYSGVDVVVACMYMSLAPWCCVL